MINIISVFLRILEMKIANKRKQLFWNAVLSRNFEFKMIHMADFKARKFSYFGYIFLPNTKLCVQRQIHRLKTVHIPQRSDYIIGFVTPAISPNKSKKLTWPIVLTHNLRGKVWVEDSTHGFRNNYVCEAMFVVFSFNLCRVYCVPAL